jgi:hypothetical protein
MRSLDGRLAVDWFWEELFISSFGISPSSRFIVGPSVIDWPLGRLSKARGSLGAFFTYWFIIGPSVVCRSLA